MALVDSTNNKVLQIIVTEDDWNSWKNDIIVDYIRDNHFTELKDAEMLRERIQASNYSFLDKIKSIDYLLILLIIASSGN